MVHGVKRTSGTRSVERQHSRKVFQLRRTGKSIGVLCMYLLDCCRSALCTLEGAGSVSASRETWQGTVVMGEWNGVQV